MTLVGGCLILLGMSSNDHDQLTNTASTSNKRRNILSVAGILLLLLAAFLGPKFLSIDTNTELAKEVARQFVESVASGDADKAYSLTADGFRSEIPKDYFSSFTKTVNENIAGKIITDVGARLNHRDNQPTKAEVVYEVQDIEGKNLVYVDVLEIDDKWQVSFATFPENALKGLSTDQNQQ